MSIFIAKIVKNLQIYFREILAIKHSPPAEVPASKNQHASHADRRMSRQISIFEQLPAEVLAQCVLPGSRVVLSQTNKALRAHLMHMRLGVALRIIFRDPRLVQRLAQMSHLFRLERLDVSPVKLTVQLIRAFATHRSLDFSHLHTVMLGHQHPKNYRGPDIAAWLRRCGALTTTDALQSTKLHPDVWAAVQQCTTLAIHGVDRVNKTQLSALSISICTNLATCAHLTSLDLSHDFSHTMTNVAKIIGTALPGKSTLTSLNLANNFCRPKDAAACVTAWRDSRDTLQTLSLSNFIFDRRVAIKSFARLGLELGHCTNLTDLNLGNMRMVPECLTGFVQGLASAHGLPSLTHLRMGFNELHSQDSLPCMTRLMPMLPQLEHIELQNMSLHPEMLRGGWLSRIKHLNLAESELRGHGMECLRAEREHLHGLLHLNMSGTKLDDAGLVCLASVLETCRSLASAKLINCMQREPGTKEGMCAVMRVLGASSRLTELSLSWNALGTTLAHAGHFGGSLRVLELCGISQRHANADLEPVSRIIDGCSALEKLHLQSNDLDADGLAAMFGGLSRPCSLRVLCLAANKLNPRGVDVLVQAQAVLRHLVELEMDSCGIGDRGAKTFAEAAQGWPSLRYVSMGMNQIRDDAMMMLAAARQRGGWRLSAKFNPLSYAVQQRLAKEGCEVC